MSEFNDRVRDSAVVSNLRGASPLLEDVSSRPWPHQSVTDTIARLRAVERNVLGRLTVADQNLISQQTLDNLQGPSQRFLDSIQEITDTSLDDDSDFECAREAGDELLMAASTLPGLPIRTTPQVLERSAESFDKTIASYAASFADKSEAIRSQVEEVQTRLQEVAANSQSLLGEFGSAMNERFTQAENQANALVSEMNETTTSLGEQVNEATERLEREVTSIQESFRSAEQSRANEFVNSQNSRLEAQRDRDTAYRQWLEGFKSEIADLRGTAISMLEEVAGATTAEHYMTLRGEQNKTANIWRRITIGSFIFLIAASVFIYFDIQSIESLSVATALARYGIAFPSLALATYALRQSGHHRKREEDTARVSHELMLLWPFMHRLPEEERQAQLKVITPLYFKGGLTPQDAGDKIGLLDHIPGFAKDRSRTQPAE